MSFAKGLMLALVVAHGTCAAGNEDRPPVGWLEASIGGPSAPSASFQSLGNSDISALFGVGPDIAGPLLRHSQNAVARAENSERQIQQSIDESARRTEDRGRSVAALTDEMQGLISQSVEDMLQARRLNRAVVDLSQAPFVAEADLPYQFHSPAGEFHEEVVQLYRDFYQIEPRFGKQQKAKEIGLIAVEEADHEFFLGDRASAEAFKELSIGLLDVAVGLDPVTGFGRSAYELLYGINLITGAKLGTLERSLAFVGVATAGGSKSITQTSKVMWRIFERTGHLLQDRHAVQIAIQAGERLVERAGHLLGAWRRNYKITAIEDAVAGNALFPHSPPPFQPDTQVVFFETVKDKVAAVMGTAADGTTGTFALDILTAGRVAVGPVADAGSAADYVFHKTEEPLTIDATAAFQPDTGVGTLGQPALDQKAKELQQDPGYQASGAGIGMGTTGDAPVGSAADVGSTAGHVLRKVPEPVATDSAGQADAVKPTFEPNPKHGAGQKGRANPAPTNPQETLDNSVRVSENSSRKVGADKATGEFDVFDEHAAGKFHGHSRVWEELTEAMKSALIKEKITNHKGKIL